MKWSEEDKIKRNNVKGLFTNPSTRPVVFITAGILLGMIGIGFWGMGRSAGDTVEGSASVASTGPNAAVQPGSSSSSEHLRLVDQQNQDDLKAAQQAGTSSLPTITGSQTGVNDPLTLPTAPVQPSAATAPTQITLPPPVVEPTAPVVAQGPIQQPQAQEARSVSSDMSKQIEGYLTLWGPDSKSMQEYSYLRGRQQHQQDQPGQQGQAGQAQGQGQAVAAQPTQQATASANKIKFVRAGTIVPARLLTPLNSDAPGPVLAEITTGPLAGARLMGSMTKSKESLLVSFSSINKPGWDTAYTVNAIAMSDDGSTAMATDVNHHYISKYTGMLVGSFLSGYGQGLQQQGKTTVVTPTGGLIQTQDTLSTKEIQRKAGGNVLSDVGKEISTRGDHETTVKVEGRHGESYPIHVMFVTGF